MCHFFNVANHIKDSQCFCSSPTVETLTNESCEHKKSGSLPVQSTGLIISVLAKHFSYQIVVKLMIEPRNKAVRTFHFPCDTRNLVFGGSALQKDRLRALS